MSFRRWDSIHDMPMFHWNKISEGELEYMRKRVKLKQGRIAPMHEAYHKDDDAWMVIYQQYIDAFGHQKNFLKIKKHEHNIARLKLQFIEDENKYAFNRTLIRIEETNIDEIKKGMRSGLTINEANVYVSKFMDARGMINFKNISVFDYYTILSEYNKSNKPKPQENGKKN